MKYNIWANCPQVPMTSLLSFIVDNRGKTVPTTDSGHILIATNCVNNKTLYPIYDKVRYLSEETYQKWFRAHPISGDILFVNKGTPGRVCMVPDPVDFCIAQDMISLRADSEKIYNKYLFAILRSTRIQQQIYNTYVGDVIPHFKKQFLNQLLIPVPERKIQEVIGDFYFDLSYKIELNNKINANLEAQAQAIFKSWFVDFEPFKDGEFVDSELGPIPKGWRVGTLSEIANITMGQSPNGNSYNETADGAVFFQGRAEFGWRFPTIRLYTSEPKRMAQKGDVLLSVRAPVGDINVANENCCIGRGLAAVRSKCNKQTFIFYLLKYSRRVLDRYNAEGTVFGSINKKEFYNLKILIPSEKWVERYEEVCASLDSLISSLSDEINVLIALRDALLPKLMSGEITVPTEGN